MNNLKKQLKTISRSLTTLSKQFDSVSKELGKVKAAKKAAPKKKAVKKAAKKVKAAVKKKVVKKKTKKADGSAPVLDNVYAIIKRAGKKGAPIDQIKKKSKLNPRQISNALYKMTKRGRIKTVSRGTYVAK